MNRIRKFFGILLCLTIAISYTACKSDISKETASTGNNNLHIQLNTGVDTLDCQLAVYDTSFEVLANTNEGLMCMGSDGQPENGMAESYTVSDDGLTYQFKLRDAYWSNGNKVTANDFVYGWLRTLSADTAAEYEYLMGAYIKNGDAYFNGDCSAEEVGLKALDDTTLQVTLESPCTYFLSLLYLPVYYPLNHEFYESCGGSYATSPDTLLSNGPFKVASYSAVTTNIELVKNDKYWNTDSIELDTITFQVIEDSQQALLAYKNNQLDLVSLSGDQVDLYKGNKEYHSVSSAILWYISPNISGNKELQNLNLRKALALSYDRDAVANNILRNGSISANYIVPNGLTINEEGKDYRDCQSEYEAPDKAAAAAYWKKAKEELGIDSLKLTLVYDAEENPINVAAFLKEEMEKALDGLTIELKQMPKESRVDTMMSGDFDLGITRWGPDYGDPTTFLDVWRSDNACNFGKWSNKDYDAIMDKCASGEYFVDKEARWSALLEAEAYIMNDYAAFPIYQEGSAVLMKSTVHNVEFHSYAFNRIYKNATVD